MARKPSANCRSFHLFAQVEDDVLAGADEQQAAMMAERVILIDDNDNVIGHASKKECKSAIVFVPQAAIRHVVPSHRNANRPHPNSCFSQPIC